VPLVKEFIYSYISSVWRYDILISKVQGCMLGSLGLISDEDIGVFSWPPIQNGSPFGFLLIVGTGAFCREDKYGICK
jgi:hypothetical protein